MWSFMWFNLIRQNGEQDGALWGYFRRFLQNDVVKDAAAVTEVGKINFSKKRQIKVDFN